MAESTPSGGMRVVGVLAVCQALLLTNNATIFGLNAIVGALCTPSQALATLPVTAYVLGTATMTIPASLLMRRIGRRNGFRIGSVFGLVGSSLCALAVARLDFWLLCFGAYLAGGYNACGQYYRFAAVEAVPGPRRSLAISLVLGGGLAGAFLGPESAKFTKDLLPITYLGPYIFLAIVSLVTVGVQSFICLPPQADAGATLEDARPLGAILAQPRIIVAILSAVVGYGVMNFMMTSTPLSMIGHDFQFADAAFVIEWHIIGMYLPSFFTGSLIRRTGSVPVILTGALILVSSALTATWDTALLNYWLAMVLVGVGWNFLFIGGTTLLTEGYRPSERAKVQGFNDFCIFSTTATTSIVSGALLYYAGWQVITLGTLPFIAVALAAAGWLALHNRASANTRTA